MPCAERLAAFAAEIDPTGERVLAQPGDVSDQQSCTDAAAAAVFLASERARMITGQSLMVNAGHLYPVA